LLLLESDTNILERDEATTCFVVGGASGAVLGVKAVMRCCDVGNKAGDWIVIGEWF
jgi:hypothetical protein